MMSFPQADRLVPSFAENEVTLNGTPVHEKRKKIRSGDTLRLSGEDIQILGED